MNPDEEQSMFDAKTVLSFPANDIDDANAIIDRLLDRLEEEGFELGPTTIEESVKLVYD